MALSFLRCQPPLVAPPPSADGSLAYFGGDLTVWNTTLEDGSFQCKQRFKAGSPHTGNGKDSTAAPPMHVHLEQIETLEVLQGKMVCVLDGVESVVEAGSKVVIMPGQTHTFWPVADAEGEDLLMQATSTGKPTGKAFDDRFVRNFYGYLSSCASAQVAPSPFQVFHFLDSAGVAIAAPLGAGKVMNLALGRIGGGLLLGYKTDYPEFASKREGEEDEEDTKASA